MKTLAVSFLSLFLFFCSNELSAQAPYRVGDVLLDEIEGPWIQVVVRKYRQQRYVLILYGQECIKFTGVYFSSKDPDYLYDCIGLKRSDGDLLNVSHYTGALNLLEKHGFQLIEILSDGVYLMKKGEEGSKRRLIDKVGSDNDC